MVRSVMLSLAVCAIWSLETRAEVTLQRKYMPNTTVKQRIHSHIDQVLNIAGQDQNTSIDSTTTTVAEIGERNSSGIIPVKVKFESMQANLSLPGGFNVNYDSANPHPAQEGPLAFVTEIFRAMSGAVLTYHLDQSNAVVAVEGTQEVINSVSAQAATFLKADLEQEVLAKEINQQNARYPEGPVKVGDTWQRTEERSIGSGQTLIVEVTYKYEGTVERNGKTLDRITSTVNSVKYEQGETPSPAKIVDSDLKVKDWKGEILFDRELGDAILDESKGQITGTMSISIAGQNLEAKLDLKMSNSTQTQ